MKSDRRGWIANFFRVLAIAMALIAAAITLVAAGLLLAEALRRGDGYYLAAGISLLIAELVTGMLVLGV